MIWKIISIIAILLIIFKRSNIVATFAQMRFNKGKITSSVKIYDFAEKIGKPNYQYRLAHAYIALLSGDLQKSNELFEKLKLSNLTEAQKIQVNENQALVYWKNNEPQRAEELLLSVLDKNENVNTYGSLGCIYAYGTNLNKALEFNEKAYEYSDSDKTILDNLAYTYLRLKKFEKAEEIYDKLIALNPKFPECYYHYGKYKLSIGLTDEGIKLLKEALTKKYNYLSMVSRRDVLDELEKNGENNQ